jgi:hypothetical protein
MSRVVDIFKPYQRKDVPSGADPLSQIFAASSYAALIVFVDLTLQNGRGFRLIIDSESGVTHHASEHRLVISECLIQNVAYEYLYPMYVKCELTMDHLTVNIRRTSVVAGRMTRALLSQPISKLSISVADVMRMPGLDAMLSGLSRAYRGPFTAMNSQDMINAEDTIIQDTIRRALVQPSSTWYIGTKLAVPKGLSPCAIQRQWRAAYVSVFNRLISESLRTRGLREVNVRVAFEVEMETGGLGLIRAGTGADDKRFDVHVPTGRAVDHNVDQGCRVYAFDAFSAITNGHAVIMSHFEFLPVTPIFIGRQRSRDCLLNRRSVPLPLPLWRDGDNDAVLPQQIRAWAREDDPDMRQALANAISERRVVPDIYESHDRRRDLQRQSRHARGDGA